MTSRHTLRPAITLTALSLIAASAIAQTPARVNTGARLRDLYLLGDSLAGQTHGGITMTLVPVPFDTQAVIRCEYRPPAQSRALIQVRVGTSPPAGVTEHTHAEFVETRFQAIEVTPPVLSMVLTIRNGMNRVFRGAGAVVQFRIGSELQVVPETGYVDFISALIPPNSESQVRLRGVPVAALRDSVTITVSLFDVVTVIDNAGNITARDNFQWQLGIRGRPIRRDGDATQRSVWLPNADAQVIRALWASNNRPVGPGALPTSLLRPDDTSLFNLLVTDCRDSAVPSRR